MKKILITGENSYVGTSVEKYLSQWPDRYRVDTVDMIGDAWRGKSFAGYDTVYHVAGIAHSDVGKVSGECKALYFRVNTELTIETARKAKADGAKQFIFMSSAIVYGNSAPIGCKKRVGRDTPVAPANFYGESKVKAEQGILPLSADGFRVCVIRSPMIYGPGCKGNYPVLAKLARKLPLFPRTENERSMLYVENLAEFVRLMIDNEESGIFMPQNADYVSTDRMVRQIAAAHGKKICVIPGFGWALKLMSRVTGLVNKAFGNLSYDQTAGRYKRDYQVCDFEESIRRTEGAAK